MHSEQSSFTDALPEQAVADARLLAPSSPAGSPALLTLPQLSLSILVLALLAYATQALLFRDWFVDDAAISFSFVRNFGGGEGLVLTPGGERVEAYSNPLWVFLLVPFSSGPLSQVAAMPFIMAKVLSLILGGLALVAIERLGRRLLPEARLPVASVAALLTALHPPFLAWTQGGLEGPLYIAGILWGLERLFVELDLLVERPEQALRQPPWSALLFCGVALTRPEGLMFPVLAGVLRLVHLRVAGPQARTVGWTLLLRWALTFLIPWGLYQLWHLWYFQAWVTNTYYVKKPVTSLLERVLFPTSGGWLYFRSWLSEYWLHALTGLAVLPLLERDIRQPGRGLARAGVALAGAAAIFFALYAEGDWMFTWRFMMPVAPPVFLLGCVGLYRALEHLPARVWEAPPGRPSLAALLFALPLVVLLWPALEGLQAFYKNPTTSVADVKTRSDFFREAREKLGLEGDVVYLDPDLGATSYYSGMRVVDTWGLGDVAFARHNSNQAFPVEYVLEEVRPSFAHVFGYWNTQTHLLEDPRWNGYYVPLPAYRMRNGQLDGGNWVRREHLRASRRDYPNTPDPMRVYASALELVHATLEPRAIRQGQTASLTLIWRLSRPNPPEQLIQTRFRGPEGAQVTADHSILYGWLPPSRWLSGEVLKERVAITVPEGSPDGTYTLEVNLLESSTGRLDPGFSPPGGAAFPRLQVGQAAVENEVKSLVSAAERLQTAGHLEEALNQARQAARLAPDDLSVGALVDAAQAIWRDKVLDDTEELFKTASARQAADTFRRLYWSQRTDPVVLTTGQRLGEEALQRAEAHCAASRLELCFEDALAAVTLAPPLSKARQLAESVRMRRSFASLPPEVVDDAHWISSIVLGTGQDAQSTDSRATFKPGEAVNARIFWSRTDNHRTEWRWHDPSGVMRFLQWQTTTDGTGSSFAFISPNETGTWTLELRVNDALAAVRTFQVAD